MVDNKYFENAARRFLFTMSNRTSYKFLLDRSYKECGHLDAPFHELNAGTKKEPAELRIRGYKRNLAPYGVTYTLHFRISKSTDEDTDYGLHIFLAVGELTENRFGWYIAPKEIALETPEKWYKSVKKHNYNQRKVDCYEKILNDGGKFSLCASVKELEVEIEMHTDNEPYSTPVMLIKPMTRH